MVRDDESLIKCIRTRRLFLVWSVILIIIFIVIGVGISSYLNTQTQNGIVKMHQQMTDNSTDSNIYNNAEKVYTGIYVDNIHSFSLVNNEWEVTFDVWFNWTGDYDPGNNFQVLNGQIVSKNSVLNNTNGNNHYSLYEVTSIIDQNFHATTFPMDHELLMIDIQDRLHGIQNLVYVPYNQTSTIGSDVTVPGYNIAGFKVFETPYTYSTNMNNPTINGSTFSDLRTGILLNRPGTGIAYFIVSLVGIFVAVLAALASVIIKLEFRFGVLAGAMFLSVGSLILINNSIPDRTITLAGLLAVFGMIIIALSIVESLIAHYYYEKGELRVSKKFDYLTVIIMTLGFIAIVIISLKISIVPI